MVEKQQHISDKTAMQFLNKLQKQRVKNELKILNSLAK